MKAFRKLFESKDYIELDLSIEFDNFQEPLKVDPGLRN